MAELRMAETAISLENNCGEFRQFQNSDINLCVNSALPTCFWAILSKWWPIHEWQIHLFPTYNNFGKTGIPSDTLNSWNVSSFSSPVSQVFGSFKTSVISDISLISMLSYRLGYWYAQLLERELVLHPTLYLLFLLRSRTSNNAAQTEFTVRNSARDPFLTMNCINIRLLIAKSPFIFRIKLVTLIFRPWTEPCRLDLLGMNYQWLIRLRVSFMLSEQEHHLESTSAMGRERTIKLI
jgi:hypothetical protein